jgi:hypothetical protein
VKYVCIHFAVEIHPRSAVDQHSTETKHGISVDRTVVIACIRAYLPPLRYNSKTRTSEKTNCISITQTNRLMLLREIITVYSENLTKPMNTLCGQNVEFMNVKAVGTSVCSVGFESIQITIKFTRKLFI